MKKVKIFSGIFLFFISLKLFNLFTCSSIYDGLFNFTNFRYNDDVNKIVCIQNDVLEIKPHADSSGFRCYDRAPILLKNLRSEGFFTFPVYLCEVDNFTDIFFKRHIKSHVVIAVWLKDGVKLVPTNTKLLSNNSLNLYLVDDFRYNYSIPGIVNRKLTSIIQY